MDKLGVEERIVTRETMILVVHDQIGQGPVHDKWLGKAVISILFKHFTMAHLAIKAADITQTDIESQVWRMRTVQR